MTAAPPSRPQSPQLAFSLAAGPPTRRDRSAKGAGGEKVSPLQDGGLVYRDYYEPLDGQTPCYTWHLTCSLHGTERQRRREVRPSSTRNFGEFECIAYLEVWKAYVGCPDTKEKHQKRRAPRTSVCGSRRTARSTCVKIATPCERQASSSEKQKFRTRKSRKIMVFWFRTLFPAVHF